MQPDIFKKATSLQKAKRVGRGGKKGTYSGKGMKGQKARAGFSRRATFEGGKSSIVAVTKKLKGFKPFKKEKNQIIKISEIERKFKEGEEVNPQSLLEKGLIKKKEENVKILGEGKLSKKLSFKKVLFSQKAKEIIEQSGSKIEELPKKKAEKKIPQKNKKEK